MYERNVWAALFSLEVRHDLVMRLIIVLIVALSVLCEAQCNSSQMEGVA